MKLKKLTLHGFKSFATRSEFLFTHPIVSIVGPNGSGKSNIVEAIRFVLGEQSGKSLRTKTGSDLIFVSPTATKKMNRASVAIIFDNSDRVFSLHNDANKKINIDFDEIELRREVFSDGVNKYSLNGHEVRLKDILEVIASVNIGSSGHHIISQGEADRLLNANPKDRKAMIEDALGLKIYQYRIKESERKLDKTHQNLKEVEIARREIAPHLKFLKTQVKKIERAKELGQELQELYMKYLNQEDVFLYRQTQDLTEQQNVLQGEIDDITRTLDQYRNVLDKSEKIDADDPTREDRSLLSHLAEQKRELARGIGRLEGMIELAEAKPEPMPNEEHHRAVMVALDDVTRTVRSVEEIMFDIEESNDIGYIKDHLKRIRSILNDFITVDEEDSSTEVEPRTNDTDSDQLEHLHDEMTKLHEELQRIEEHEHVLRGRIKEGEERVRAERQSLHEKEKEFFVLSGRLNELRTQMNMITLRIESLEKTKTDFEEELKEARVLIGEVVDQYRHLEDPEPGSLSRESQETLRKKIERIKIKLEDVGAGGGGEVMREYEELSERDEFLERESTDLITSMESLTHIIRDLKKKLGDEFERGVGHINTQFHEFFTAMFGGGKARVYVVNLKKRTQKVIDPETGEEIELEEDQGEPKETGIEIEVSLPKKRVKDLEMLSGGERSLTSIALLFALTQVNPPPFLVLDETDAALDEANSQKYGDMLENLSKYSQLVVVTHNRETMSRAGILYGVTLGTDGASKVLSIKFDEAVKVAK